MQLAFENIWLYLAESLCLFDGALVDGWAVEKAPSQWLSCVLVQEKAGVLSASSKETKQT